MTGLGISLYLDEDVDVDLAAALRNDTYDVTTCLGEGNANQRKSDEWQLEYATKRGRAIFVHNVADYIALDRKWRQFGRQHCGIIIAPQEWSLTKLIQRTKQHLNSYTPADQ